MKLTGSSSSAFRDDERWNPKADSVEFTLDVTNDEGTREVPCRVTQEALADITGGDAPRGVETVRCYQANRDRIRAKAGEKFAEALFEADGSIMVLSADLNG